MRIRDISETRGPGRADDPLASRLTEHTTTRQLPVAERAPPSHAPKSRRKPIYELEVGAHHGGRRRVARVHERQHGRGERGALRRVLRRLVLGDVQMRSEWTKNIHGFFHAFRAI